MAEKNSVVFPLVSIIIRSIDRSTLAEALESVASQTYPNIEVILVNAKGADHRTVSEWCGRFPVRMVDSKQPLSRSRAANAGLDEAVGEYLIFLDDDDWFEADHIEKLVQAIEHQSHIKVVYSGAKCVDENNHPLATQFATPFDSTQLIAGNYIPIHTALFSKELLDRGCYVDESLDLYEDWDFWIQASRFTDFLFVDRFSAAYRITQQSGFGVNADSEIAEKASLILFKKWLPRLQDTQLTQIMTAVRLNRIKEQQLQRQGQQLGEQQQQLTEQEQQLKEQQQQLIKQQQQLEEQQQQLEEQQQQLKHQARQLIEQEQQIINQHNLLTERDTILQEIFTSTIWRITHPIRWSGSKYRWLKLQGQKYQELISYHGNFTNLTTRAYSILRQEGIKALSDKFVYFFNKSLENHTPDSYQEWIRSYDTLTDELRVKMRALVESFQYKPLISIVMPTYNSNPVWLKEAIESVRKQIYPHWELCIADDASTDMTTRSILQHYEKKDRRIKVVYRSQNGHISAASNSALEIADGEWVALLDHDDLLSEHALFWVVDSLQKNPDAKLIYSDEDKINSKGRRFAPYFKCDWNQELFHSHNMIAHLGIYHTDLLKKIAGFRTGFEGSQDYDLALRYIERIATKQIHHIPRILYHWRAHADSTAQSTSAKPYAILAGKRALDEHFQRQKINANAEFTGYGYRIHYYLPDTLPLVTLIIPTRNGLQLIRQCVESILKKTSYQNYEILIIDNGSDDAATLQYLHDLNSEVRIRIVKDDRPFNFSALNNNGVKLARGEFVGLLNNDLEVISPDWLSEMISIALQPQVGAVGAKLWYPNETLQHGGIIVGLGGIAGHSHKHLPRHEYGYFARTSFAQNLSAVTAACLIIRKSIYEEVGGLNEQDLQVAFNDVDFCLRVQEAGYHNVWTPYAELYHHESATRGYENTPEKRARFAKEIQYMKLRWGDLLLYDPAYSPNLTLDREDFSFAKPPRVKTLTD